ncbi:MAG: hypothetical protein EOM14_00020 [Clostridia bacterium]|nr:hypothetical protein [Clostridia bacterium]
MYCCLAELKSSEKDLSEQEIDQLRETVKLQLNPTDKFTALHSRMLFLTPLETYLEVKDKFSCIQENFEKNHGPSIKLICGFAEVKDDDLLSAIDGAKQMLARTTDTNPLSGMYYYRFSEV